MLHLGRRHLCLALACLALAACQLPPGGERTAAAVSGHAKPVVVATIFPLASLVQSLCGDEAEVVCLLPPGASAHTFELTAQSAANLSQAGLVVRVGPGLDDWVAKLAGAGRRVWAATEHATLISDKPGTAANPHVWLDPELVRAELVPSLVAALVACGVGEASSRAAALEGRLQAVDRQVRTVLKPLRERTYVGTHAAWAYFDQRYDLRMVASLEPADGVEPSAGWLATVVAAGRASRAGAVMSEVQGGDNLARTVAAELHAKVAALDPLGGPGLPGRDSYEALIRYNADQFAKALSNR